MDPRIKSILEYGIRAPSGDNCQPWLFKIEGLNVSLYNDPQKDTSLYNLKQRASLIAHGALIETLNIAAPHFGLEPHIDYFPDKENLDLIANIRFSESATTTHPLLTTIIERQTNREPFQSTLITTDQIQAWKKIATPNEGWIFSIVAEEKLKELSKILSYNERIVFEEANLHKFLFDQIRWTPEETEKTRDGLDLNTLGLNAFDKIAFSYLKNWRLVQILNKIGLSRIIQRSSKQTLKTASSYIFITIPDITDLNYIMGGKIWQRLLLNLTKDGLTAQPIVGLTCLMQANTEGVQDLAISKVHKALLTNIGESINRIVPGRNRTVLAIFRVGKAPTTVRSLRRKIEDLLV